MMRSTNTNTVSRCRFNAWSNNKLRDAAGQINHNVVHGTNNKLYFLTFLCLSGARSGAATRWFKREGPWMKGSIIISIS